MQTTKTKGCGCGGGGGCSGGCGCKPARLPPEAAPAPCSPCDTSAFVRPRFFAGQLLTEDDLEALTDYMVSKQRFHNARLFGAGVVCGLELQCGPCDATQFVIEPGYAIDCCGNDLVLTCERTFDLAPMIRELQAQQKGRADCTDPCPPPKPAGDSRADTDPDPPVRKRYCVYARYAERPDQPVAAYPVGDDCDAARCEPTRIVEGIVFELRCPPEDEASSPTRGDAVDECERIWAELIGFATAAARVAAPPREVALAELHAIRPDDFEAAIADKPAGEQFVARTELLAALAFATHDKQEAEGPLAGLIDYADDVAKRIVESEARDAPTQLERVVMLDLAGAWAARAARPGSKTARAAMSFDDVYKTHDMLRESKEHIIKTSAKLRELGGCAGKVVTDCQLREAIERSQVNWNVDDSDAFDRAGSQLKDSADLVSRLVMDCKCAATNPPCPTCDDPGVLLACLEVERCKVVHICNSVRPYVLAPSTLRYWDYKTPAGSRACCVRHRKPASQAPDGVPQEAVEASMSVAVIDGALRRTALRERLGGVTAPVDRQAMALHGDVGELKRRIESLERAMKRADKGGGK